MLHPSLIARASLEWIHIINDPILCSRALLGRKRHLKAVDNNGQTILHAAVTQEQVQLARYILQRQIVNPDAQDFWTYTALHYAAILNYVEVARMLLDAGAAIDKPNSNGNTALHIAARHRNWEIMCTLLRRRANPQLLNSEGLRFYDYLKK